MVRGSDTAAGGGGSLFPSWTDDVVIRGALAVRLLAWIVATAAAASSLVVDSDNEQPQPSSSSSWTNGPILASVMIDSTYTLDHVQEAVAIRQLTHSQQFVDAYQGSRIHMPPLGLAAIETIFPHHPLLLSVLILVLDLRIAYNFYVYAKQMITREYLDNANEETAWQTIMDIRIQPKLRHVFSIAAAFQISTTTHANGKVSSDDDDDDDADHEHNKTPVGVVFEWQRMPLYAARLYFVTAAGLALLYPTTLQNLPLFFLTEALASHHSTMVGSTFCLAISTYLDVHNMVFLIPLTAMMMASSTAIRRTRPLPPWILTVALFAIFTVVLQYLAYLLVGRANYGRVLWTTHLHSLQLVGMSPSLSILWYFAMQVFRRFTRYFTIMFSLTPYTAVGPLSIRLYQYPSVLVAAFWALAVLFRPPSTLYKLSIAYCFLLTNPRSLARCKPAALVLPVAVTIPICLYLVTYWLWVEPGTGEANFCFFQCVAYNVMVAGLFLHFIGASLCREKAVRLTAKRHQTGLSKKED